MSKEKLYKGILLAGGYGTRLRPITSVFSKHLLPIYDKPMIYYSLSVLMLADIREILLICTERDMIFYQQLFGDGSSLGINIEYKIQKEPDGIASVFLLGSSFIGDSNVCLILGDNIFYGQGFSGLLDEGKNKCDGGVVFSYQVLDPRQFGVVELDSSGKPISIEEKPVSPKSNLALTGLYFYNNDVVELASNLLPSERGELEISDINNLYLDQHRLDVINLGRGIAWLDTGTHDSLIEAGQFVKTIEDRQGLKIGCLEEIAFRSGWISASQVLKKASGEKGTNYSDYLMKLLDQ